MRVVSFVLSLEYNTGRSGPSHVRRSFLSGLIPIKAESRGKSNIHNLVVENLKYFLITPVENKKEKCIIAFVSTRAG